MDVTLITAICIAMDNKPKDDALSLFNEVTKAKIRVLIFYIRSRWLAIGIGIGNWGRDAGADH